MTDGADPIEIREIFDPVDRVAGPVPERHRPRWVQSRALRVVAVGAVAIAATVWFVVTGTRTTPLRFDGATVARPAQVLASAEQRLAGVLANRPGRTNGTAHCYFVRPTGNGDPGIQARVLCGPVLFYDGDPRDPYLNFPLTAAAPLAGSVAFSVSGLPDPQQPVAAPPGVLLIHGSRASAPLAGAGFAAPIPPSGPTDLVQATLVVRPAIAYAPASAQIGSDAITVVLDSAGYVDDFGLGPGEESAPPGERLLALQVGFESGENVLDAISDVDLGISVDGGPSRRLPLTSTTSPQLYVAAVSATATRVDLALTDHGITQTLALPSGTPGPSNITLLGTDASGFYQASGTAAAVGRPVGGGTPVALQVSLAGAQLEYFVPTANRLPRSPRDAFLTLNICYSAVQFHDGLACHSFQTPDLTVTLSGGATVHAEDLDLSAQDGYAAVVFEVPAGTRTGTVTVTRARATDGVMLDVVTPLTIPFSLTPQG